MKLYIANDSRQMSVGGGWSFISNFTKGLEKLNMKPEGKIENADTVLIPSASMVRKETVQFAKDLGKKIYLRIDNIPRNSRNKNTGTSRVAKFAKMADGIIFQSNWAREWVGWWLQQIVKVNLDKATVILNGIDTTIFNKENACHNPNIYLYSRYNSDETKNWHEAWYMFASHYWRKNRNAELWLIGNYSQDLIKYNFDFFQGETINYLGIITDQNYLANIYKQTGTLLAPYYNDACSNTILEARACGCQLVFSDTGGTPELLDEGLDISLERMTNQYISFIEGGDMW